MKDKHKPKKKQLRVYSDYDKAYKKKPEVKKRNSNRSKARYALEKQGRVSKGDGKDVDHKNGNAKDNSKKNLRVISKTANRSDNKHSKGESQSHSKRKLKAGK